MSIEGKGLEELIKKIIMEELKNKENPIKTIDSSGVGLVKAERVKLEKFDTGNSKDQVYLQDIFSVEESPRIGCGMMEMTTSVFDWTLKYDEIDYIIEGTLEIIINGKKIIGNKGDVILIPKNSKIQFSSPNYAKFLYVVYPANWQSL